MPISLKTPKSYTFLIGTMDDFESIDELIEHFEYYGESKMRDSICNCAAYEFEAPAECDKETVAMIGRGIAFGNNWSWDDTFSCVVANEEKKDFVHPPWLDLVQCSEI